MIDAGVPIDPIVKRFPFIERSVSKKLILMATCLGLVVESWVRHTDLDRVRVKVLTALG